jgi:hypothetical protein
MQGVELQDYRGDYEDIAELVRRVWIAEYGGRILVPIPDVAFLRWRMGPQSGALCLAAYDGTKLVGSVFSVPHCLRIGPSIVPVALCTGFTVDPRYRPMALPMIERLRRHHEESGIAFSIGMVPDAPTSISYRFWMKYAQTFPQRVSFLFQDSYWAKFLAPGTVGRASIKAWQRLGARALGPLLRVTPHRYDPHVRAYHEGDLERCAQLLAKASTGFDWALVWPPEQLGYYLANPASATLLFERDGCVRAMVHYHCLLLQGRESVRTALIDLWADDLTAAQRVRLLSHLCNDLRDRGLHLVVAPRCAMIPTAALIANLFLPGSEHFHIGIFFTRRKVSLSAPRTWSLLMT